MRLVGQVRAWDPRETEPRRAEKASVAIPDENESVSLPNLTGIAGEKGARKAAKDVIYNVCWSVLSLTQEQQLGHT